ncbi:ribosomal RNA processing protein 1 homolog A-like [Amphibalanus amphitrite]|uniref:ribosomal RNA processing protein 1 homolog A-like n=1 Tax=Amphibalanus amphitrite TaxID=1232801 RepID=UPI001C9280D9|nr:ribosomal RNA processing protein 1 homolog A-like [Amphibalanus amphitrite]
MAPTRADMEDGVEIKFAQKLAGNEKEGRDKALRKLKKWIQLKACQDSSDSAFTELELLKLWKGLFFCMWMSDKPLVQEQLAEELSQLVHVFPHRQDGVTFCRTFFTTMAREWHGIDVIRREKYMMLVRRLLRQTLALLLPAAAGGGGSLPRLVALCEESFARREDPATLPLGLQLHLVEIFLEEVAKVAGDRLTEDDMEQLLAPFVQVLKVTKQSALRGTITDSVFYHLMRQSDVGIAHDAIVNGETLGDDSDDDNDEAEDSDGGSDGEDSPSGDPVLDPRAGGVDVTLPQLSVDYGRLADSLTAAGAEPSVRQKNRTALYRLAQQFRDLSEGEYPLALKIPDNIDSDSDLSDEDLAAAVLRLQSTKKNLNKDSRKNQKKRQLTEAAEEPQPKKKKKLRHKQVLSNGVIDTGDELMAEAAGAPPPTETPAEEADPQTGRRRTLKEKRRLKLKERREAELAKQKKKNRKEAKKAKLNGDVQEEHQGMANGAVLNGDHDTEEAALVVDGGSGEPAEPTPSSAEPQESATPVTASKKKKKKRAAEEESPKTSIVPASIEDDSTSPKTKKKKKKQLNKSAAEAPSPAAEVPSPAPAPVLENGAASPPEQKKKSKKKKAAAPADGAPPGDAPPAAAAVSSIDWSLGTEDNWDDADPAPAVQRPAKKAAAQPSAVAHFVPSKPVPAFVKLRTGKKGAASPNQKSPATPRTPGKTKKVIINLAENKAQGFKEHLITVRNSPQVPHNPSLRPVKGLLKPSPAPSPATPVGGSAGGRRSRAADFFSV